MIVVAQVINLLFMICFGNKEDESIFSSGTLEKVVKIAIVAICILIVAIPEGMALAVSIAMALSITKLKDDQILV